MVGVREKTFTRSIVVVFVVVVVRSIPSARITCDIVALQSAFKKYFLLIVINILS